MILRETLHIHLFINLSFHYIYTHLVFTFYVYIMHISCIYYVYIMYIVCVRSHFRSSFASCSELCVQNFCVQPGAMEGPENQFPAVIRVGKREYNYIYTYRGNATYKCGRGSDWKVGNEVLWLMKEEGKWYAFDAPNDQIPASVDPNKVRFVSAHADAHIPRSALQASAYFGHRPRPLHLRGSSMGTGPCFDAGILC